MCWCDEIVNYVCSNCEKKELWRGMPSDARIMLFEWCYYTLSQMPEKSIAMHGKMRSFGFSYTPEDVPDEILDEIEAQQRGEEC